MLFRSLVTGAATGIEAGREVAVSISGVSGVFKGQVQGDGSYAIQVDGARLPATDGRLTATVTASDAAGNLALPVQTNFVLDRGAPSLGIDAGVAGDDILNQQESLSALVVRGTTNAEDGQIIELVVGGKRYLATASNQSYALSIPSADQIGRAHV